MAVQIQIKREFNAEMIHAVVRMDERTYSQLKRYMHCTDQVAIRFPTKTALYSRGRGWYRIECDDVKQAIRAVQFAVKVIRRFLAEQEREVEEQIKLLVPTMLNPELHIASFSNAHSEGEYGYIGLVKTSLPTVMPVSQVKLAQLANKFNVLRKT